GLSPRPAPRRSGPRRRPPDYVPGARALGRPGGGGGRWAPDDLAPVGERRAGPCTRLRALSPGRSPRRARGVTQGVSEGRRSVSRGPERGAAGLAPTVNSATLFPWGGRRRPSWQSPVARW